MASRGSRFVCLDQRAYTFSVASTHPSSLQCIYQALLKRTYGQWFVARCRRETCLQPLWRTSSIQSIRRTSRIQSVICTPCIEPVCCTSCLESIHTAE